MNDWAPCFKHVRYAALALALLLNGCKKKELASAVSPPQVSVIEVQARDVPVSFEYIAQTQCSQLVNIQARVNGFLERRVYTEGKLVKAADVLFEMDAKPFKAALDEAEAALAQCQAAYEVASMNYSRTKTLTETKAMAQKDLDDARGAYLSTAAAVDQAKAAVETAKLNLSYTTITSPVSGITSAALQTDGTYIDTQNSLLTSVAVLSPIWVNFSLSENELQKYQSERANALLRTPKDGSFVVEIVLVDGSVFPYKGRITFAEPSYNIETGTFLIRTSVENPQGTLRPNQYVRARLRGAVRPNAILVPQRAVQESSKGQFVWLVNKNSKAEMRPVLVGPWYQDHWFILEGLHAGEKVVIDGGLSLQPGMPVAVAMQEAPESQPATSSPASHPED